MELDLVVDFSEAMRENEEVLDFWIGPSSEAIGLAVAKTATAGPLSEGEGLGRADKPYDASVLVHNGIAIRRTELRELDIGFPIVQVLPNDELLVVGTRCERREDGSYDLNGRVFGPDGVLRREFLLGDGIQDVQTTRDGRIWVSYFDEGIFGNLGWGNPGGPEPVGSAGLVRFDVNGDLNWEYKPPALVGYIADCYALNVTDRATWAYYYTDFPLVRISSDDKIEAWHTPVAGARVVAVSDQRALFYGGYGDDRDRCVLCEFGLLRRVNEVAEVTLGLPDGVPLPTDRVLARGSTLHAFVGSAWYQRDLQAF